MHYEGLYVFICKRYLFNVDNICNSIIWYMYSHAAKYILTKDIVDLFLWKKHLEQYEYGTAVCKCSVLLCIILRHWGIIVSAESRGTCSIPPFCVCHKLHMKLKGFTVMIVKLNWISKSLSPGLMWYLLVIYQPYW